MSNHSTPLETDWVWTMPNIGTTWCTCGRDPLTGEPLHQVTRPLITRYVLETLGSIPDDMTNKEISLVVLKLWNRQEITPPLADALLASVNAVVGEVQESYPVDTAIAVIKHFSHTVVLRG